MNIRLTQARFLLATISLALLASCTPLKLDPPGPDKQSVLVLPATHTRKAQSNKPAYYYVYQITGREQQIEPYDAVIKYPVEDDIVLIDTLPPGGYKVSRFSFYPMGVGDHTYGNNSRSLNEPFFLAPGAITIFPKSLNLTTYNATPGRGASTNYSTKMEAVTPTQRRELIETLKQLPNFESWTLMDADSKQNLKSQGYWAGKWESTETGDCSSGKIIAKVEGKNMTGTGTSRDQKSLSLVATINDKGKVAGSLLDDEDTVALVYGGVYAGGEIAGKIVFTDGCESYWSVLKRN